MVTGTATGLGDPVTGSSHSRFRHFGMCRGGPGVCRGAARCSTTQMSTRDGVAVFFDPGALGEERDRPGPRGARTPAVSVLHGHPEACCAEGTADDNRYGASDSLDRNGADRGARGYRQAVLAHLTCCSSSSPAGRDVVADLRAAGNTAGDVFA